MKDFINQTQLPGVLVAKALMSKHDFDAYLIREKEMRKSLENIGYVVSLSDETKKNLRREIDLNIDRINAIVSETLEKATVLSNVLTDLLKTHASKENRGNPLIYPLSQILFIWDEFVDFSDYENSKGNLEAIRESAFYRGATEKLISTGKEELEKIKNHTVDTSNFEEALYRLQRYNKKTLFTYNNYMIILNALAQLHLSSSKIIYFLLNIEAVIFVKTAILLSKSVSEADSRLFMNIKDYKEGILITKQMCALNDDKLEHLIEKQAQDIVLSLTPEDLITTV